MTHPHGAPTLPRLFGEEFARDPRPTYDRLRAAGPVAPAELTPGVQGLVVTSHEAAVELLNKTENYTRDSRTWNDLRAGRIPPDSPLLGILGWQPTILFADPGPAHAFFHTALHDCLGRFTEQELEHITQRAAVTLTDRILPHGKADLVTEFAMSVPLLVFADLIGCTPEESTRMVQACEKIIDAGAEAGQGAADFGSLLGQLAIRKQHEPGHDLTTWLLQHRNNLLPEQVASLLYTTVGAGNVPTSALIVHATRLLLQNDKYAGDLTTGSISVARAIEKALWEHSPLGTFTFYFAREDTFLAGCHIPAGTLVMISHAACNTDPALGELDYSSKAHVSWSAGTHRCPAPDTALIITKTAITSALDELKKIDLADSEPAPNRPGLFHQCPAYMNVVFQPRNPTERQETRP